jgi:hypothetical protein
MGSDTIVYKYTFNFKDGKRKVFEIILDKDTLARCLPVRQSYPDWARLEVDRCPGCRLASGPDQYCPAALSLLDVVEAFSDSVSYDNVCLEVEAETRTYLGRQITMQKGVSSLVGLCMASSGCPAFELLQPMVRYHLPLSDGTETAYRVISMYLLSQYFVYRRGAAPDWDFKQLITIYKNIKTVNENFAQRLRSACRKDANLNAVVILDAFADHVLFYTGPDSLKEIEKLFHAYLNGAKT